MSELGNVYWLNVPLDVVIYIKKTPNWNNSYYVAEMPSGPCVVNWGSQDAYDAQCNLHKRAEVRED